MNALSQRTPPQIESRMGHGSTTSDEDYKYLDVRREIIYGLHVMNSNKTRLLRKFKRLESCCDDVKLADAIRTGVEITNKEYDQAEQVLQDARVLTLQGRLEEARDAIDRLIRDESRFFEKSLRNPYILADVAL